MDLYVQLIWLFVLALPIACISWTFTHEDVFREPREYCTNRSLNENTLVKRKFFYIFTCEYCFSHYITLLFIILTRYQLLMPGGIGYVISGFSLVWVANLYMNVYALIRQSIKKEKTEIKILEQKAEKADE